MDWFDERNAADAPKWLTPEEARSWAAGWNAAVRACGTRIHEAVAGLVGKSDIPWQARRLGRGVSLSASDWLAETGAALAKEVDRLWPHEENDPAYRAACLAEEAGEVNRAVTKRRHAEYAPNGLCKGMNRYEWSNELRVELAQALGVILDIAHREGFDLMADVEECLAALQARSTGS